MFYCDVFQCIMSRFRKFNGILYEVTPDVQSLLYPYSYVFTFLNNSYDRVVSKFSKILTMWFVYGWILILSLPILFYICNTLKVNFRSKYNYKFSELEAYSLAFSIQCFAYISIVLKNFIFMICTAFYFITQ